MVPGDLFESDEGETMSCGFVSIRVLSRFDPAAEFGREKGRVESARPKGDVGAQNFRSVVSGQTHRRNLPRALIGIELDRTRDIHGRVADGDGLFGEAEKFRKEIALDGNGGVRLLRNGGEFSC